MNCLVCGGRMYVWEDKDSEQDYYCPSRHGPFGEGLFYQEIWDGEKYVLTHSKPTKETIAAWKSEASSTASGAGTSSSPATTPASSQAATTGAPTPKGTSSTKRMARRRLAATRARKR